MRTCFPPCALVPVLALGLTACAAELEPAPELEELEAGRLKNNKPIDNPLGAAATFSTAGFVDLASDFSIDYGTNGRTCLSCHTEKEGWSIAPAHVQARFEATGGLDPLFRPVDGATSPAADVSTVEARRAAYALLLDRGLIRVGMAVPAGAEFELVAIDDPYGHASAAELSLFRRPLPAANLPFIPRVMWDGRVDGADLEAALAAQADGATLGHAQAAAPLSAGQAGAIVGFEIALSHAQVRDGQAGQLTAAGARGGPEHLSSMPLVRGPFDLFETWAALVPAGSPEDRLEAEARLAIARGQALFNDATTATGRRCGACHNVANVGTNQNGTFFDVGVSGADRRTDDVPLYTLRNLATGELRETTDPGRALVTGLWRDVDRFKVPSLRGLAARAPYFHNGAAETLLEVVHLYEEELGFDFTPDEEADLVAFLAAL